MTSNLVKRLLPFLNWPRVTSTSLTHDLIAGITVSLLAIPQSLAYAQLAGVPAHYGLYAAFIPSIVAVLFGSSALLSTGPVAMTSLLTAASVSHITAPGTTEFVSYVTLLALLSGLFQIGFGLARAGVLLNLLSHPVLMGFINAAALIIALSQLSAMTGIEVPRTDHFLMDILHLLGQSDSPHLMSLTFGLLGIALLVGFKRFAPRLPGVLAMAVILTCLSYATGYAEHGGKVVGDIPTGMPNLSVPAMSWRATMALLPAAFVIALISFMEAMSSCKVIAIKTRTDWDENQELIGQGLAKVVAAFCHSMPVSGSFSRSALNLASHGRISRTASSQESFSPSVRSSIDACRRGSSPSGSKGMESCVTPSIMTCRRCMKASPRCASTPRCSSRMLRSLKMQSSSWSAKTHDSNTSWWWPAASIMSMRRRSRCCAGWSCACVNVASRWSSAVPSASFLKL